jgi:hypothetical protein
MAASSPPLVRTAVLTLCQSASAAHTASSSARRSASKASGSPTVGVSCVFSVPKPATRLCRLWARRTRRRLPCWPPAMACSE